jgi:outer membrane protein insertion porin family
LLAPNRGLIGLLALLGAAICPSLPSAAQGTPGFVQVISVEGNKRIEADTVRSYLSIGIGDSFDPVLINDSLKSLFATGLFADVNMRRQGRTLIVSVVENPIINRLAFEGNRRIKDDVLSGEVQLRPRVVYTRTKVQNDVARILEIYRRSGRFAAIVEPKVIQLKQNRVDIIFEINEGEVTGIRKINFVGNKRFSDGDLREAIQTKETRWYRFLTSDDTYDPDRLTFDRELLRRFYLKRGYADFRVASAVAELSRDRKNFFVTFTVEEGARYRLRETLLESSLKDLSVDELKANVSTEVGDWYNADKVEESIQQLTDAIGSLGYAFVEIRPRLDIDRDDRSISLTFEITEGPRVYVERIDIHGNFRTLDEVVRREFRLAEGDAFNTAKIRRSRQKIRNLGFFEKVEITNREGSASDTTIVDVDVAEQATGELSFGAGFSSLDGPLADVSIRERNLLGRGQDLLTRFTLAGRRQEIELQFTEPYFLDKELSAGFDVFNRETDQQSESSFDEDSIGAGVRMGYAITDFLGHTLRYGLRRDKIEDVDDDASRFIRDQEGTTVTSLVGHSLLYDKRDNRFEPTEGYFLRLSNDLAGLGGDQEYLRSRVGGGTFYSFSEKVIGSLTGETGYIFGLGQDLRISDRFFVGGQNLRGFGTAGVGPRDSASDDALGGNVFLTSTADVSVPLGLPSEFNIKGSVFTDVGTLFDVDDDGSEVEGDDFSLRASVGMGLTYVSPLGPIRVDYAIPVLREDFDEKESFRFSFGTRF